LLLELHFYNKLQINDFAQLLEDANLIDRLQKQNHVAHTTPFSDYAAYLDLSIKPDIPQVELEIKTWVI